MERPAALPAQPPLPGVSNHNASPNETNTDPTHDPRLTPFFNACLALQNQLAVGRYIETTHEDHHPTALERLTPIALSLTAPQISLDHWASIVATLVLTALPDQPALYDRLRLRQALGYSLAAGILSEQDAWRAAARIRIRLQYPGGLLESLRSDSFWQDPDVRWLLNINESEGITYFNQQCFEELTAWLHLTQTLTQPASDLATSPLSPVQEPIVAAGNVEPETSSTPPLKHLATVAADSGYQVAVLRSLLDPTTETSPEPTLSAAK